MALTRAEAHEQILGDLQSAIEALDLTVACLTEAYELLDEDAADRLEAGLFRPAQKAYAQAKRTQDHFARSTGAVPPAPEPASPDPLAEEALSFIEQAVDAATTADSSISELQDSMLPVEFGDADLRAALAAIREPLAGLLKASRDFLPAAERES